ncbi:MAG: DUF454 family protein [Bacteroidales bacterium]|nr:DUF454 family protein [Bacteroidales bacterium]
MLYLILGAVCVVLGTVGILLPLLPTTPFLLLSSFFFLKSSERIYNKLINHRILGLYIKGYIEKKGIPLKIKIINLILLWSLIGYSVIFIVETLSLKIILFIIAAAVSTHILMLKTLNK